MSWGSLVQVHSLEEPPNTSPNTPLNYSTRCLCVNPVSCPVFEGRDWVTPVSLLRRWADKMPQGNLSWISRTHVAEGENWSEDAL